MSDDVEEWALALPAQVKKALAAHGGPGRWYGYRPYAVETPDDAVFVPCCASSIAEYACKLAGCTFASLEVDPPHWGPSLGYFAAAKHFEVQYFGRGETPLKAAVALLAQVLVANASRDAAGGGR